MTKAKLSKKKICPDYAEEDEIAQECVRIIAKHFRTHPMNIISETSFIDDLHADDIDGLFIYKQIHESFGIKIKRHNALVTTVNDLVYQVKKELAKNILIAT